MNPLPDGGPYNMEIQADKTITIHNILMGDLWICGGQSNMELPVSRVMERYRNEINGYDNPLIRMFRVPIVYDFEALQEELADGYWQLLTKKNVLDFTATGYFFAKELFEKYQVPIGLIHTAVGGTPVEAWISEEGLRTLPEYIEQVDEYKDREYIKQVIRKDDERINTWMNRLNTLDSGMSNEECKWFETHYEDKEWSTIQLPVLWRKEEMSLDAGVIWFRKKVNIPVSMASKKARILLGTIVDSDTVYINGKKIGETGYRYPPRMYEIPQGILKEGENILAIRVVCWQGEGGFTPDKSYRIETEDEYIDLKGEWLYKVGAAIEALAPQIFIQYEPTGVHNGMIAPLKNLIPTGVIWYQGESNASRVPEKYKQLFELLIKDWRRVWQNEKLPFIYVQLPNFKNTGCKCNDSTWAEIRDAQLKILELDHTGMAVTIDVGEWNDLHPLNKKDIGKRLALIARNLVYGEEIVCNGPLFEQARELAGKVIISFEHAGSGLLAKGGEPEGFTISSDGKHFIPAKAILKENEVIVWNECIKHPV